GYNFKLPAALVQEQFNHERLKQCIVEMHATDSTIPIFKLWKSIACYEYINDKLFMKEYIELIVLIFQNLLGKYSPIRYKAVLTTTDVLTLYQQITAMPVPELLDLLDEVVDQFAQASSEYELDNKQMSWTEWLQQYWWAPPVMVGSLFITIIKHGSALHKLIKSLIKNPFATR
ncbi:MAG TPA: hypothetical protein VFF04_06760, partial [Candidatus Babeliales bacterium]|nr:hypothetical protein [Candidatus Babeliales bacterium]